MNILAKKGLFAFAIKGSRSPYFMSMFSPSTFAWAAYSGNYVMTAFIGRRLHVGFPAKKHVALRAVEGGSVEIIRFLLHEGHLPPRGSHALALMYTAIVYEALERGHVDVLALLLNEDSFKAKAGGLHWGGWGNIFGALSVSARAGDIRTLDWFGVEGGVEVCDDVTGVLCAEAARAGQLETLKFLKCRGYRLSQRAFKACGTVGNEEILNWMVEAGCPTDNGIFVEASLSGNLAAIRWALAYGLSCPPEAIENAKYCGNYIAMLAMSKI